MIKQLALIVTITFGLGACGFTPLHSPSVSGYNTPLPNMAVNYKDTKAQGATGKKAEFLIRQALTGRMASGATSPYILTLTPKISRSSIGIRSDDVASRYDLNLRVNYVLSHAADNKTIATGAASAISTFNAPNDPYGRTAAQDNAQKRAVQEAVDRLVLKIATDLRRAQ
jgi:LPS-assembly lipoprotein